MDIAYVYPEDAGVLQCKVTNAAGEAHSSGTLKCQGEFCLQVTHSCWKLEYLFTFLPTYLKFSLHV